MSLAKYPIVNLTRKVLWGAKCDRERLNLAVKSPKIKVVILRRYVPQCEIERIKISMAFHKTNCHVSHPERDTSQGHDYSSVMPLTCILVT